MEEKVFIQEIDENIFITEKPENVSSFWWIQKIKKQFGFSKIGHAGTLDPFASGLLIVAVNAGTKKISSFVGLPKTYTAVIRLGIETDTLDKTGVIISSKFIEKDTYDQIDFSSLVEKIIGTHIIPVPSFSAKKVSGERLYKLAREGKEVPTVMHTANVHEAQLVTTTYKDGYVDISCTFSVSSGTYIRSLAKHMGSLVNLPATVMELSRTSIGPYKIL